MSPHPLNVLLILCDQLRADALGCTGGLAGSGVVQTPALDRLAQEGALFNRAVVSQPTCTPSRASLLTGCYPSTLRSRMVGCRTPFDSRFLPSIFRAHGYRTASIGKIHLVPQGEEPRAVQNSIQSDGSLDYYGFQEVELVNGHGDHCFGPNYTPWVNHQVPDWPARLAQRTRLTPNSAECYRYELPLETHSTRYITDHTVHWLQDASRREKPFFLHVSFPDPHHPFTVPEPYASLYATDDMPPPIPGPDQSIQPVPIHLDAYHARNFRVFDRHGNPADRIIGTKPETYDRFTCVDWAAIRAIYGGMIRLLDDGIGAILDALRRFDLLENTLVVFSSDHGDYLGDHGLYGKGLPFESSLRVPLIFRGPNIRQTWQCNEPASLLDVAPTLLEMAGIPELEGVQGCSLAPVLRGQAALSRQAALVENDDDFIPAKMRTLVTSRWKLTRYTGEDFGELYDLVNDPSEVVNRWGDPAYQAQQKELSDMLFEEVMCSFDTVNSRVQEPHPRPIKWIPKHNLPIEPTR